MLARPFLNRVVKRDAGMPKAIADFVAATKILIDH